MSSMNFAERAAKVIKSRTPAQSEVEFNPSVGFLDPKHELTREEIAKVAALGDRTAISYGRLRSKVLGERGKTVDTADGEVSATAQFFLAYALAARSSDEIAHTSVLEHVNAGPSQDFGDSPIAVEGMSVLAALRDACAERHWAFEALSSRGAIFPDGYWRVPAELSGGSLGQKLEGTDSDVFQIYGYLTKRALEYYLQNEPQREKEPNWRYDWRVLSMALDDARQVTNLSFLGHFAGHPNSALALRDSIIKHASSFLPETVEFGSALRGLMLLSLPTMTKYTEASDFLKGQGAKREKLMESFGVDLPPVVVAEVGERKSRLLDVRTSPEPDKSFLAGFLAQDSGKSFEEMLARVEEGNPYYSVGYMVDEIIDGMTVHDKLPSGLERVRIRGDYEMSIGAVFEAIRHRGLNHLYGRFSPYKGHSVPDVYKQLGLVKEYEEALGLNRQAYEAVSDLGGNLGKVFAPYFSSRADIVDYSVEGSATDFFHMLKLRASKGAHPDISGPMYQTVGALQRTGEHLFDHIPVKR